MPAKWKVSEKSGTSMWHNNQLNLWFRWKHQDWVNSSSEGLFPLYFSFTNERVYGSGGTCCFACFSPVSTQTHHRTRSCEYLLINASDTLKCSLYWITVISYLIMEQVYGQQHQWRKMADDLAWIKAGAPNCTINSSVPQRIAFAVWKQNCLLLLRKYLMKNYNLLILLNLPRWTRFFSIFCVRKWEPRRQYFYCTPKCDGCLGEKHLCAWVTGSVY